MGMIISKEVFDTFGKENNMDRHTLAIKGGGQAIQGFRGKGEPKTGHEGHLVMAMSSP